MCGIVGAVSTRNIVPILVQGLQRLEYRGYDSCGVAVHAGGLKRARSTSRVAELLAQVEREHLEGTTGIAHTRWATHGAPAVHNAHPHFSHGPGEHAATAPAGSGWCTTGSSRTTTTCARRSRPRATSSPARPTPRSSRTWSTACTRATCSRP
jgi:glutamine phosphoribosylpyrophosphate amidotransferase